MCKLIKSSYCESNLSMSQIFIILQDVNAVKMCSDPAHLGTPSYPFGWLRACMTALTISPDKSLKIITPCPWH